MSICARSDCYQIGTNGCAKCLREPYCSVFCQQATWAAHKTIYKSLKRLSEKLQPYEKVVEINDEILKGPKNAVTVGRLFKHLQSYAEF